MPLTLAYIPGSTSITQGINVSTSAFTVLAYLNAATLKELDTVLTKDNWFYLTCGDTEDSVVYAEPASLSLAISEIPYSTALMAIEAVESFPVLTTLDIYGGYPFDDDLLFRGSGGTLQNIRLPFSAVCRDVLGRFNVLKHGGVTRMSSIHIDKAFKADQAFVTANIDIPFEQQVHCILETASFLVLFSDTKARQLHCSALCAPKIVILRHLDFGGQLIDVTDKIEVVAAIPNLFSLKCRFGGCGQVIETIPAKEARAVSTPSTTH